MQVQAYRGRAPCREGIRALLLRVLMAAALVLMPAGMLEAAASATGSGTLAAPTSCDGHDKSSQPAPESKAHCPSCVAIAAHAAAAPAAIHRATLVLAPPAEHLRHGLEQDVATPPPKRA